METNQKPGESYQRFHVLHRLLHIIVIVNFTMLAITGFLLYFSGSVWASSLVSIIGGAKALGWLHRFCAVFLYIGVLVHILWLFYYKIVLKQNLSGAATMMPNKKDIKDIVQNVKYMFNKGNLPSFDRFSYLEKVDYWAVMLGMQSMGITGLMMWFPEFFSRIFPGYFINIAVHFHLHEAVLAVMYIGLVHMSDTHLVPDVFPLQKTIFTGRIDKLRFMEDHPEEWKRQQMTEINQP